MKMIIVLMSMLSVLITNNLYANDLGVMGETYPIVEVDFLDFIQARIESMRKNGQWLALQNHIQQDAFHYRDRPKRLKEITRAVKTKTWSFDPSIVLDHDIITPDGKLIAKAGTKINPLNAISLSKTLIFYDGDDEAQVKWVVEQDRKLKGYDKLILINGSVLNQEKHFKKPIYFDQAGKLTARFGISHVPASVMQDRLLLQITEVKL